MTAKKATGGTKAKAKPAKQKTHYTRAQNQQMRQYGRQLNRIRKRNKHKRVAKRGAVGPVVEGYWLAGDNDVMPSCVAVAIANCVLAQTGHRCSPDELKALSVALSAKDGAIIPDALHALISQKESD